MGLVNADADEVAQSNMARTKHDGVETLQVAERLGDTMVVELLSQKNTL